MNKRKTVTEYEELAARWLTGKGFEILEKNYRCRIGEIDLIARDGRYLVFVEVKYRSDEKAGDPSEAVNWYKQKKICQTASWYLRQKRIPEDMPCRFDVVSILGSEIYHIKMHLNMQNRRGA